MTQEEKTTKMTPEERRKLLKQKLREKINSKKGGRMGKIIKIHK